MNKTLQLLYDEHEIIVNAIYASRQSGTLIGKEDDRYEKNIRELIDFFRSYADQYHHHKEEIILFPEMVKRNEMLEDSVIHEMLENHEDFREMIRDIEKKIDEKKYDDAQKQLNQYTEALLNHIAVENDEVFQMAESLFDDGELDNLGFRFNDCDRELGDTQKQELAECVESIRKNLILD